MGVVPLSTVSPSTPILDLQGLDKSSNTVIEKNLQSINQKDHPIAHTHPWENYIQVNKTQLIFQKATTLHKERFKKVCNILTGRPVGGLRDAILCMKRLQVEPLLLRMISATLTQNICTYIIYITTDFECHVIS